MTPVKKTAATVKTPEAAAQPEPTPEILSAYEVTRVDGSIYVSSFTIGRNPVRSAQKLRNLVENEKQCSASDANTMIRHWIDTGHLKLVAYNESMLTLDEGVSL